LFDKYFNNKYYKKKGHTPFNDPADLEDRLDELMDKISDLLSEIAQIERKDYVVNNYEKFRVFEMNVQEFLKVVPNWLDKAYDLCTKAKLCLDEIDNPEKNKELFEKANTLYLIALESYTESKKSFSDKIYPCIEFPQKYNRRIVSSTLSDHKEKKEKLDKEMLEHNKDINSYEQKKKRIESAKKVIDYKYRNDTTKRDLMRDKLRIKYNEHDDEIKSLEDNIKEKEAESQYYGNKVNKYNNKLQNLNENAEKHESIVRSIEKYINIGHSAEDARKRAQKEHDLKKEDMERQDYIDYSNDYHTKVSPASTLQSWMPKHIGRHRNKNSLESSMKNLKNLQTEQENLNREAKTTITDARRRWITQRLEEIDREIIEVEKKIELFEDHPELLKRGAKRIGDGINKTHNGINAIKDWSVNGAVDGYHRHKAKIAGAISTVCAFIILFLLMWMKVVGDSVYIPVNWIQIVIFMLLALLLETIKTSMDEDAQSRNEAREIIFLLVALTLILTAAIKDPAVGFWTSLIFCAIISVYLLLDFYTNSALVSIVLAIVMMVVISFTAAGWMDELGVQTEKLAVQTGFAEAIETSINSVSEGVSDVWLMITNPNAWYAQREMEQNAQKDPAASDRAVEITTAKITPSIVNLGDEINLLIEVKNFGDRDTTKPARDVEISAKKIGNHQQHFELEGSTDEEAEVTRYVGDIMSNTGAQEVFEIKAPPAPPDPGACIATFRLEAGVSYGYDVDAMGNIFIIGGERYDELVKQDKFVPEKQVAKSSSGPVSVSIMTNLPQPIAVDDGTKFSIHFGIVNTRSSNGKVNVTGTDIAIPKEFVPVEDGTCKLCKLPDTGDELFDHYSFRGLYNDDESDTCSVNADKTLLIGGDIKIFKCEMEYEGTGDIPFKKPMEVHVSIDYIYKYTKTVSFTVRKRDIDLEADIARCS